MSEKRIIDDNKEGEEDLQAAENQKHETNADGTSQEATPEANTKEDYNALNDKYIRLLAEFDNFKKRIVKERLELMNLANQEVIRALLAVMDDFDRAEASLSQQNTKECEGFLLIHQKLKKILEQNGLSQMEIKKYADFDAELHEAVAQMEVSSKKEKDKIIDVTQKGYYLNNRLIRHAKVVVGK